MYFRFTLFNSATLGVTLLAGGMIWARFRFGLETTWLLLYYVPIALYGLASRASRTLRMRAPARASFSSILS